MSKLILTANKFSLSFILVISLFLFAVCNSSKSIPNLNSADIIVYGGTSAAVIAAVEAVHSGKTVLVVSPDMHIGGLSSGGLGYTDTGNKSTIGGLSREFYHRIWLHYNDSLAWNWQKKSEYGNKGQGTIAMDGENRTIGFLSHMLRSKFLKTLSVITRSLFCATNGWIDLKDW